MYLISGKIGGVVARVYAIVYDWGVSREDLLYFIVWIALRIRVEGGVVLSSVQLIDRCV